MMLSLQLAALIAVYGQTETDRRERDTEHRLCTVRLSPVGRNNFRCVVDQRWTNRAVNSPQFPVRPINQRPAYDR